jgi:hypothetical protein
MIRLSSAIAVCFVCTSILRAQSTNASLTGRVSDPSNAVIVHAEVIGVSTTTNFRHQTTTNASGEYYLPNLLPGPYRIEVEKTGASKN